MARIEVAGADLPGARARRRLATALAVVLAALIVAGCSGSDRPTATVFGDPAGTAAVAGQAKIDTVEHSRIVAAYGGIYHDDKVEQMLVPIVSRIVAASDRPDQSYRITILNAPAVNAFALPDGYLYVTRGLLALAGDSSEVAAVLAHEMAHVTANHAVERQNKARNALIVSQVVNDVLKDDEGGQLALAASRRSLAAFSRQQELEADAIGIKTVGKAGYDPFAAARFLTTMARFADYRSSLTLQDKRPDFLATHPSTPERVDFAERAARQFGAPGIGEVDRDRYLDGIDSMVFGDDPSQGFVRDRSFIHPGLSIAFTVPEGFVIDNTSDAVLATGTDGTALRFDAVGLAEGTDLAAYLKSGWVNGLDETSVLSFSINGLKAATARAQAKGWFFEITVIQTGDSATFRFIFANEAITDAFTQAARETVDSFRTLTPAELAGLKALRIKVVTAAAGDSEASLAKRMRGVDRPLELFRALNDLTPGAAIKPGTRLKIVTDG
jgi:predicted Zn-dependent protease